MTKQLSLFPEIATRLSNNLDEEAHIYAKENLPTDTSLVESAIEQAYKDGAGMVFAEIIDLLKKYLDLHES